MIRFGLLGCGRIGRMHAHNLISHPEAELLSLFDVYSPSAAQIAAEISVTVAPTAEAIITDKQIDAVLIASSTDTHADLIESAARAGKAIFCEKPIALDIARVVACRKAITGCKVPIQMGFNRRFDPGHRAARNALQKGEIGDLQQMIITSRDPTMPPRAYLESAGGLFRDMTIHDFDLARYMLDDEPVEVYAMAESLIAPEIGHELKDFDSAMIIMRTADGKMCHINNARATAYGYDQRVELFGSAGMLISQNRKPHELQRYTAAGVESAAPYLEFFVERYAESFRIELDAFIQAVKNDKSCAVGFDDGYQALLLAEAAYRSLQSGERVLVSSI